VTIEEMLQQLKAIETRLDNALTASLDLYSNGSGYIIVDGEQGTSFNNINELRAAFDKEMENINDWLSEDEE